MTSDGSKRTNFTSKYLSPCRTVGLKRKSKSPLIASKHNKTSDEILGHEAGAKLIEHGERSEQSYSPNRNKLTDIFGDIEGKSDENLSLAHKLPQCSNTVSVDKFRALNKLSREGLVKNSTPLKPVLSHLDSNIESKTSTTQTAKITFLKNSLVKAEQSEKTLKSIKKTQENSPHISQTLSSEMSTNIMQVILRLNEKRKKLQHLKNNKIYTDKHNLKELKESTERWKNVCVEALEMLHSELRLRGDSTTLCDLIQSHSIPPDLISFDMETQEFI